jgi:hypothetical protein
VCSSLSGAFILIFLEQAQYRAPLCVKVSSKVYLQLMDKDVDVLERPR